MVKITTIKLTTGNEQSVSNLAREVTTPEGLFLYYKSGTVIMYPWHMVKCIVMQEEK